MSTSVGPVDQATPAPSRPSKKNLSTTLPAKPWIAMDMIYTVLRYTASRYRVAGQVAARKEGRFKPEVSGGMRRPEVG